MSFKQLWSPVECRSARVGWRVLSPWWIASVAGSDLRKGCIAPRAGARHKRAQVSAVAHMTFRWCRLALYIGSRCEGYRLDDRGYRALVEKGGGARAALLRAGLVDSPDVCSRVGLVPFLPTEVLSSISETAGVFDEGCQIPFDTSSRFGADQLEEYILLIRMQCRSGWWISGVPACARRPSSRSVSRMGTDNEKSGIGRSSVDPVIGRLSRLSRCRHLTLRTSSASTIPQRGRQRVPGPAYSIN